MDKTTILPTVTLAELKERPINHYMADRMIRTAELSVGNRQVARHRMDNGDARICVTMITQDGNEPRENEEILDVARCYIEANVYTDEEWERYFIPAINQMIRYNNSFERWYPGYLIREKKTGDLLIVMYDYAMGFGDAAGRPCRDYTSLTVCSLRKDGSVRGPWAWADYGKYELVDKDHVVENIEKVRAYNVEHDETVPYFLSGKMIQMFYS